MCSYALRNERNKKNGEIPMMIATKREILPILHIHRYVEAINILNE
jgi:hypothetical protein